MKQLKFIFIIFFCIVAILFLGVFIFLKTLDINRFKSQITQQISKSINRDVSIGKIFFTPSIHQGVIIGISGLTVSDHPEFSTDPLFYIESAHLNIDALPLILRRQIFVSKIEFNSPKINIIRNKAGKFNIQTLSERKEDQKKVARDDAVKESKDDDRKSVRGKKDEIAFGDMLIRSIRINDGTVLFTDRSSIPTVIIPITGLDLQISNLAFDTAVPFDASVSLWSEKKNISVKGLVRVNAQNHQVRIDDLYIRTDLSDLLLDNVLGDIPSFKEAGLEEGLDGQVVINIHQMVLSEEGLLVLSSDSRLTDGQMKFKDLPIPFENMNMHFEISESDLNIKEINLPIAAGEFMATGQISDYLNRQKFIGELNINDIELKELTAYFDLPVRIEGVIRGSFKSNGEGLSKNALRTSLAGEGTLEVINGRIVDINLLNLVLSKLSFIPNLVDRIEENLPEQYKEKLNQKDTILGEIKINTRIQRAFSLINSWISFSLMRKGDATHTSAFSLIEIVNVLLADDRDNTNGISPSLVLREYAVLTICFGCLILLIN